MGTMHWDLRSNQTFVHSNVLFIQSFQLFDHIARCLSWSSWMIWTSQMPTFHSDSPFPFHAVNWVSIPLGSSNGPKDSSVPASKVETSSLSFKRLSFGTGWVHIVTKNTIICMFAMINKLHSITNQHVINDNQHACFIIRQTANYDV